MGPKRGRVKRAGKDFYMPRRDSEEDVARDQELLNGISKELSVEEVIEAVAEIRERRQQELKRTVPVETDEQERKRARIWRGGRNFYLPVRTSEAVRLRDQELLDGIEKTASVEEAQAAVEKIRREREVELAADESGGQGSKRARLDIGARIKRGGKDFYLPKRTAEAERLRDQELLDGIRKRTSREEAEAAVEKIVQQRNVELAKGGVLGSS